jgi:acetyl esterase/lipase
MSSPSNPTAGPVADRNIGLLQNAESYVYKPLDEGADLMAHVFYPEGEELPDNLPVVLCFHSSQWDTGQIGQFAPHALYFCSRSAVSILFEYRMRSSHGTGPLETMADIRTAIRWARYNHDHLGIDPAKVVALGAAAAAHGIAAAAMIDSVEFDDNAGEAQLSCSPDAMVLFSPILDVSRKGCGMGHFETPRIAKKFDPSHHIRKQLPPMVIFQGSADRVVPPLGVEKFSKRMKRKKNVCQLEMFQGKGHSFFNFNVDVVSYEAAISIADRFLVEQGFFDASEDDDGSMRLVSWREQEY